MKEMANYCGQTRTINTMFVDFYNAQAGPLKIVNYLNGLEHLAIPYTDKLDPYAIGCEMCYTVFDCITMGCMLPDGCAWKGSDFGYQCNGSGPGTWYCAQPTHVAECIENQLCNQPGMICKNDCPVGEYCTADDECEAQKALGMSCVSNRECTSNVCRNNECQECWPVSPFDVLGCNTNGHNTYICADGTCVPTCSTCDEETQNCYASGCGPCADINEACAYDHQCCDYKGDDWDSAVCAHPPIVPCFKSDPGAKCSCLFSFIGSGSCQVELCTCQLLGACAYGWWVYEILSL